MIRFFLLFLASLVLACNSNSEEKSKARENVNKMMEAVSGHNSNDIEMKALELEINSTLPEVMDTNTTLNKVEYFKDNNKFVLNYTIKEFYKNNATEQEQNIVIANFKSNHLDVAKNNPYKAPFVKGRVTFEYIYKNELDSTLFSYEIKPEDYIE
jgi:hypothetical protein